MHRIKTFLSIIITLCLLAPAMAGRAKDGNIPVFVVMPSTATPGATVPITIEMEQVADGDEVVALTATQRSFFSSIQSSVTVPDGESEVTIQATVSTTATGVVTVTALANGESAYTVMGLSQ